AEAIPHLRAALPSATRAHYTLGAELFKGGQLEEAIEHLQAFVEHHPRLVWSIEAYGMLGEAHEALGNWEEAAAAYEELYARAPNDPRVLRAFAGALNESGISHASEGRLPQALEAFRRAIAVDPALTAARLNLAL